MIKCDGLQRATASARATEASVHVKLRLAPFGPKLSAWPMVVAITADDAMALSIELQKAAIDAREREYRHAAPA
jgi:hypothetical protein